MLSKDVLGITCCMETSIIKQYQDEISYLQSLLDANGIPYDYEAYSKVQNKSSQKDVELMPLDISPEMAKFFFSMFHGRVDYIGHILHEARSQAVLARSLELGGDA